MILPQHLFPTSSCLSSSWSFNSRHVNCPSEFCICWSTSCMMLFLLPGAVVCPLYFCLVNPQLSAQWLLPLVTLPNLPHCYNHRLDDIINRNVLSHSSGGWEFEIKTLAVLSPSENCEGRISLRLLFIACRQLSSSHVSSHSLPCMCICHCVKISSFYKDSSHVGLEHSPMTSF